MEYKGDRLLKVANYEETRVSLQLFRLATTTNSSRDYQESRIGAGAPLRLLYCGLVRNLTLSLPTIVSGTRIIHLVIIYERTG